VDSEGKKTAFTTEGKSVDFYANGYEVESFVPGGDRLKMSGTSMASPQVANLAAKLLAVNPKLKPAELIKLITEGSEPSAEDAKIRLINPKKSLALIKK
jgi:subtilisin family serine protease